MSVSYSRMAPTLWSLTSVQRRIGVFSTGKARVLAFSRVVLAWLKALLQAGDQWKVGFEDIKLVSSFVRFTRPGMKVL